MGRGRAIGLVVVDGGHGEGLLGCGARGHVGAQPVGPARVAVGPHDDVDALADADGHDRRVVRLDLDEVVRDDRHLVPVDRDALHALRARVDEAQPVRLARLELELGQARVVGAVGRVPGVHGRAVEVHPPVDQVVVGEGAALEVGRHDLLYDREVVSVPPV